MIEVVIASAIIAISMGVILQLFASSISRITQAGDVARQLLAEQQIMQELAVINPAEQNQGEMVIEAKTYQWQAVLKTDMQVIRDTQDEFGTEKHAGLYQISVHLKDSSDDFMTWEQLGWK